MHRLANARPAQPLYSQPSRVHTLTSVQNAFISDQKTGRQSRALQKRA